jgi:DNA primase
VWLANERAVEYHPNLFTKDRTDFQTHVVLDLDPPEGKDGAADSNWP